jgi:hypothetical protein
MWHIWNWFGTHEWVGIWLEAIALVFIFVLDYVSRKDDLEENKRAHEETARQLSLLGRQVEAANRQANFAMESLQLLKVQAQEQQLRELWRVLPILDDIQGQIRFWSNLFDENRWNAVNKASRIMPADSSTVLIQAARYSNELWTEVRDQPSYRQVNLITAAHNNLKNAEPKLTYIVGVFTVFEATERKRHATQEEASG